MSGFYLEKRPEYVSNTNEIAVEIRQPKAQYRFFACCALFETTSDGVSNLVLGPSGDERNSAFNRISPVADLGLLLIIQGDWVLTVRCRWGPLL